MKNCFVIMPFSKTSDSHDEQYWTEFFEMIKTIMEKNQYKCIRSEVGPYKLFSNIVKNLENSDIVIAVLTDYNANVWYELGIRHTLRSGTIMLLEEGQKIPFDISDFGIVFYKDSIGLERRIEKTIKEYLEKLDDSSIDSPVISTLNNKIYSNVEKNVEKKLEDMQQLIWKLVEELPKANKTIESKKAKLNRILWVDDYPSNNETVMSLFEDKDVHFDIAINTKQGLDLFRKENYDLIITDMGRGNESNAGLSLIKTLKKHHCQIPIIVYASRMAIDRYGKESMENGAYAVTNGIGNIISLISDVLEI